MKIKRFFASEMREAIRQVKEELGADAVILSNNKVDGGIELVAAIDYDEEAVQRSVHSALTSDPKQVRQVQAKKRKSAVSPRATKQKLTDRLEDDIEDDVISFSRDRMESKKSSVKGGKFASLLRQSKSQNTKNQSKIKNTSAEKKTTQSTAEKLSLRDRKQPYISDAYEENSLNEETYPFDYESLVNDEKARLQRNKYNMQSQQDSNLDDFYAGSFQSGKRTTPNKNRQVKNTQTKKRSTAKKKVEWLEDPAITSMHEEIKSLRGILENQLSGLAWNDFARRHPHRAELLSRLYRLGIKSSLSEKLVKQLENSESLEDSWRALLAVISRNIPMIDYDMIDEGGIIALVGPTGVGKTTNIAKMAARYTLKYGAKNLALITTDSYRVGAHEQLKTYGRILGVPVYVADDETELKQVLSRLDDKQLILIDTAGMSHRDIRLAEQLSMLRQSHAKMKILAVLSAASQSLAMDEVIKAFKVSELDGCIASKVDESTSIGGIISVLIENQLQLNYISDGQKVPEDLHLANATDLLKQALGMVREHPLQIKTDELAMSYSGDGLSRAFA